MTIWGTWIRGDFDMMIDSGRITAGVPVQCSLKPGWMPKWMARLFVDPDREVLTRKWPEPGGDLPTRIQAVRFERGSQAEAMASLAARSL